MCTHFDTYELLKLNFRTSSINVPQIHTCLSLSLSLSLSLTHTHRHRHTHTHTHTLFGEDVSTHLHSKSTYANLHILSILYPCISFFMRSITHIHLKTHSHKYTLTRRRVHIMNTLPSIAHHCVNQLQ